MDPFLTLPPEPDGGPAASARPDFVDMANRLGFMLDAEIAALETAGHEPGFSEDRVRALTALAKTLPTMEAMGQKQDKADDGRGSTRADIVAFRERLARKLAALDAEGQGATAGDADPGAVGTP
ncbi:MAG: hypothetical protein VYD64_00475 [Pseudomonadota bacterium]|nr:hypothetical protein [Pseudomonadota bacterium]